MPSWKTYSLLYKPCSWKIAKKRVGHKRHLRLCPGQSPHKKLPQYSNNVTISLGGPIAYTGEIVRAALYRLVKIHQPDIPCKKAGVILLDLHRVETAPPHLFTQPNPRKETLMRTIDQLNHKFGSKTISYGQIPQSRTWYMNQKSKSHRFTTHWKELLVAKWLFDDER